MRDLPPLFPQIGPITRYVLFADFADLPPPPISSWDGEVNILAEHRLAATALRLIHQNSLPVRRDTVRSLSAITLDWSLMTTALTERTTPFLELLRQRSHFALIKGAGLAHFYPNPVERPYTDYDILVHPSAFSDTLSYLSAQGFFERESTRPPWPAFTRFCREAINLVTDTGARIDLHHHIPPWIWGQHLDPSTIAAHATPTGPHALPVVAPLDNYFIAALHILSDNDAPGKTLRAWRDVLTLTQRLDTQDIVSTASRLQLTGILRWILSSLPAYVRPNLLISCLEEPRPEHPYRLAMRFRGNTFRSSPLTYPTRLPFSNALYYALGMTLPPTPYLRSRYPDARHPLAAWWSDALGDVSWQVFGHSSSPTD